MPHVMVLLERIRREADTELGTRLAGVEGMRGSFGRLLCTLPAGGVRPTAMAADMGITKQALGERLRELEDRGWIVSTPDPDDGRALLVRRTAAGTRIRGRTERAIASMEQDWAERVGAERYRVFTEVLAELGGCSDEVVADR